MEKQHLILIGFMGSGKSTIGAKLSDKLQIPMVDTDKLIEEEQRLSIATIFERFGETEFRQMETKLLKKLQLEKQPLIISTGGGLPLKTENSLLIKKIGLVVWLDVNKTTVLNRLKDDTTRPLLKGDNVEAKVEALLAQRREQYTVAADVRIDVNEVSEDQIVEKICSYYRTNW